MKVTLILFTPYSDVVGKCKICLNISENKIDFKNILVKLVEEYPRLKTLIPSVGDKTVVYGNLLPIRKKTVLRLEDEIHDDDIITIYGSLSGG